jgi:hypothetical protein
VKKNAKMAAKPHIESVSSGERIPHFGGSKKIAGRKAAEERHAWRRSESSRNEKYQ